MTVGVIQVGCPSHHMFCKNCFEEAFHCSKICPLCREPIFDIGENVAKNTRAPILAIPGHIRTQEGMNIDGLLKFRAEGFCRTFGKNHVAHFKTEPLPLDFLGSVLNVDQEEITSPAIPSDKTPHLIFKELWCN